jgi:hypothetical protein
MIYAHVLGVLVLLAQWVSLALLVNKDCERRRVLIAGSFITFFSAPLVITLLFMSDRTQLTWITPGSAASLWDLFMALSGYGGTIAFLFFIALLINSLRARLQNVNHRSDLFPYLFLWIWFILPILIVATIGLYRPILQTRYLLFCLPPFLTLAADGLAHLRPRLVSAAALAAIVTLTLVTIFPYYRSRMEPSQSDDWRDAARYVLSQLKSGDVIVFPYSAEEIPFRAYQDRLVQKHFEVSVLPAKTNLELLTSASSWTKPADIVIPTLSKKRIWVVTAILPNSQILAMDAALAQQLKRQPTHRFGFVTVDVFVPGPQ